MKIRLASREQCTGCSACSKVCPSNAISMRPDAEGFLVPVVDPVLCVECGVCVRTCPVINPLLPGNQPATVYAAIHQNDLVREKSSSGGVFSALAEHVLAEDGVVFGAAFDQDMVVQHIAISTIAELDKLRGSKYVQSDLKNTFVEAKHHLQSGEKVLFCGTPCQIAGLKKFLKKNYSKLVCIDFICHGVPSPFTWRSYLDSLPLKRPDFVSFRDKTSGWHNFQIVLGASSSGPSLREKFSDNYYMKAFLADFGLRKSCYACKFKGGHSGSDITIGDFWGVELLCPELDDDKGISVAFIHTEEGDKLFKNAPLNRFKIDVATATKHNSPYYASVKATLFRSWFFKKVKQGQFSCIVSRINRTRKWRHFFLRVRGKVKRMLRK